MGVLAAAFFSPYAIINKVISSGEVIVAHSKEFCHVAT